MSAQIPEDRVPGVVASTLESAGLSTGDVWDLVNGRAPAGPAVPGLLALLPNLPECRVAEGVVRAITDPATTEDALPALLDTFVRFEGDSIRWSVANAIFHVWKGRKFSDRILRIAGDRSYGPARERIVQALGRAQDPAALSLLITLVQDETVVLHALTALERRRPESVKPLGIVAALAQAEQRESRPVVRAKIEKLIRRFST